MENIYTSPSIEKGTIKGHQIMIVNTILGSSFGSKIVQKIFHRLDANHVGQRSLRSLGKWDINHNYQLNLHYSHSYIINHCLTFMVSFICTLTVQVASHFSQKTNLPDLKRLSLTFFSHWFRANSGCMFDGYLLNNLSMLSEACFQ